MPKAILMFGSPGAGKGKVSERLVGNPDKPLIACVETGKCFRKFEEDALRGDPIAQHICACMRGKNGTTLVDDATTIKVVEKEVGSFPAHLDVIWDAPRSASQVVKFCEMMRARSIDQIVTIHLQAPRSVCKERMLKRAKEGEVRPDNDEEMIDRRLNEYEMYANDTIAAMREHTTYLTVDATFKTIEVAAIVFMKLALLDSNQRFKDELALICTQDLQEV